MIRVEFLKTKWVSRVFLACSFTFFHQPSLLTQPFLQLVKRLREFVKRLPQKACHILHQKMYLAEINLSEK